MKATWWAWQMRDGRMTAMHFFSEDEANDHARSLAIENDSPAIVAKGVRTFVQKTHVLEHDQ